MGHEAELVCRAIGTVVIDESRGVLSRTEYLRRQMLRVATTSDEPVSVESVRQFARTFADLADPEVMRGAWE